MGEWGNWDAQEDLDLVKSFAYVLRERPNELRTMFWKRVKEVFVERNGNRKQRNSSMLSFRFDHMKMDMREYVRIMEMVNHHPQRSSSWKVSIETCLYLFHC